MRAAALQRRIAAIVVGQHLEVGEGDVGGAHLVEQRPQLGIVAAVEPALQDGVTGEQEAEGLGHGGRLSCLLGPRTSRSAHVMMRTWRSAVPKRRRRTRVIPSERGIYGSADPRSLAALGMTR